MEVLIVVNEVQNENPPRSPVHGGSGSLMNNVLTKTAYTIRINRPYPTTIGGRVVKPWVSLSASPNPVEEGNPVDVIATVGTWRGNELSSAVTIPVNVIRAKAEIGDFDYYNREITIDAGATTGTITINTYRDKDEEDETFRVRIASDRVPDAVQVASPSSVLITITDTGVYNTQPSRGADPPPALSQEDPPPERLSPPPAAPAGRPAAPPAADPPPAEDPPPNNNPPPPPDADPPPADPPAVDPPPADDPPKVGDFNDDGSVDLLDYDLFVSFWDTKRGEAGYDAKYDLDGDGVVALGDYSIFVANWGK